MTKPIIPYKDSEASKKEQVSQMFDAISTRYDGLNRVISMGIDVSWRKKVLALVQRSNPSKIIDLATGTGDLALLMTQTGATEIIGLDISKGMLAVGVEKIRKQQLSDVIQMVYGDSENIPYDTNYFDAATVAFGIRNFENLHQGLTDILRVLKPGGQLVILETSVPTRFPFKQGYFFYTRFILPLIGKLFSKDRAAYGYLSESAAQFPYGDALKAILAKNGYTNIQIFPQSLGVATIYQAYKP
jgi:demethylmenaquinone methyltransferase/2-methoxy-6-polyprenyl-1,4-benzoquinol methylase